MPSSCGDGGSIFQTVGPATRKILFPQLFEARGMANVGTSAEWRQRPPALVTKLQLPAKYGGSWPCMTRFVRTAILQSTRRRIGSKHNRLNTCVMCSR
jgi:hypothetical protein